MQPLAFPDEERNTELLFQLTYPQPPPANSVTRFNNFRRVLDTNPCPAAAG